MFGLVIKFWFSANNYIILFNKNGTMLNKRTIARICS